ncbi:MAG TPA: class I SAM-dependent methyltransferase [Nitriliruptorales bacterium]|nr:class I SAM-dependent methyltransferase [Nitriliruptorales bacterium]
MGRVHPLAEAFGEVADTYERARPDYPEAAVAWIVEVLGVGPGRRVADVGAGTGKLTRQLRPTGAALVAVEPVEGMRAHLADLDRVAAVAAVAERLPFRDASLDAIVAGQAFHWFDGEAALRDWHRALRPGGGLALVWNARDGSSVAWVAEIARVVDRYAGDAPRWRHGEWREAFDRTDRFGPLRERSFPHPQRLTPDEVVERYASTSFIAALDEQRHAEALAAIRQVLATHPDTRGREHVVHPYRTDVFWTSRR